MKEVDEVMQFRRADPFKPFVIELKDGRRFVVREPEHVGRNEANTRIGVAADADSVEMFPGSEVARVLPLRRGGLSGKRRRGKR